MIAFILQKKNSAYYHLIHLFVQMLSVVAIKTPIHTTYARISYNLHLHYIPYNFTTQFSMILNLWLIWNVCYSQPIMCISQIRFCIYQEKTNIGLLTLFVATWNDYAGIYNPFKEIYKIKQIFIRIVLNYIIRHVQKVKNEATDTKAEMPFTNTSFIKQSLGRKH